MVDDLRALLRLASGRVSDTTAAVLDSRTLRSTLESGHRAGYGGAKHKKEYERLPAIVAGVHFVAFACLFLHRAIATLGLSS